jgi:dTDP-4-dehydrorhamnose 3,5-epimerase
VSRFISSETPLAGVTVVERRSIKDVRGFLSRLFCATELVKAGWTRPVAQINHTLTRKRGTVRGLHFQHRPHAEMKLVMCLRGAVWDVAVDLRAGSETLLRWYATELSADNGRALLIPEGCAHGFQTLTDDCELLYCHSAPYVAESEGLVSVTDPRIGIGWPLSISEQSERDRSAADLPPEYSGIPS